MDRLCPCDETLAVTVRIEDGQGGLLDAFSVMRGVNLWTFLRRRGLFVGYSCSGVGMCGSCAVRVAEGYELSLTKKTEFEAAALKRLGMDESCRLSCQAQVVSDVVLLRAPVSPSVCSK